MKQVSKAFTLKGNESGIVSVGVIPPGGFLEKNWSFLQFDEFCTMTTATKSPHCFYTFPKFWKKLLIIIQLNWIYGVFEHFYLKIVLEFFVFGF